jgi:hypothetical protein
MFVKHFKWEWVVIFHTSPSEDLGNVFSVGPAMCNGSGTGNSVVVAA